jgi:hypothetical protein
MTHDTDTLPDAFFKDLSPKEVEQYKHWARANHSPGNAINGCWHPVIREECARIDKTAAGVDHFRDYMEA